MHKARLSGQKWFQGLIAVLITVVGIIGGSTGVGAATALYVATGGSDTNPGTQSQPWRTIQRAISAANPGDTIYVMAGTYNESLSFTRSGSASAPITLANYNGAAVTIHGGSSPAILDEAGTQYWRIQGLRLDSNAYQTVLLDAWGCDGTCRGSHYWTFSGNTVIGAMKLYGSYNVVQNNTLDGTQHKGEENALQDLYPASHHNSFTGNHIYGFAERGIWSRNRTHDNVISGNHIHDIGTGSEGMGIDIDGFGNVAWQHTISGNTIYNCGESGIELENTFASVVQNNIVHDTGEAWISIINYGATIASPGTSKCTVGGDNNQYGDTDGNNDCEGNLTGNVVRQNVLYRGASLGGIMIRHAGGITITGNTLYGSTAPGIKLDTGANYCPQIAIQGNIVAMSGEAEISVQDLASITVDDHNLLYHQGTGGVYELRSNWSTYTVSAYASATGKGQGSIQADPLFTDAAGGNFTLKEGSPAIDAGISTGTSTDIAGAARPQGNGYDIGAYEFASTSGGSTDGGSTDGGSTDGGSTDGGSTDGGSTDGGSTDGGSTDGGSTDGGSTDGGSTDGGSTDGGSTDGGGGSTVRRPKVHRVFWWRPRGLVSASTNVTYSVIGSGFAEGATVTLGGDVCSDVHVTSDTELTCVGPESPTIVEVVVTNSDGTPSESYVFDPSVDALDTTYEVYTPLVAK